MPRRPACPSSVVIDPDGLEDELCRRGFTRLAGVDEVGRGPLAGPVVAGAVVLPLNWVDPGLADSKALTPRQRGELNEHIQAKAADWAIGFLLGRGG